MKIIEDALKSKKLALTIPWDEIEETAQEDVKAEEKGGIFGKKKKK